MLRLSGILWFALAFLAASAPADDASSLAGAEPDVSQNAAIGVAADLGKPGKEAIASGRNPRVLFITAEDSAECVMELERLQKPGGEFDKMRAQGWTIGKAANSHLQIVDRTTLGDIAQQLNGRKYPVVACVDHGEIVRSFTSGCTTPLDAWTFGWLAKGIDERPAGAVLETARVESTLSYPLRGNHWSVDGDWTPSREKVIGHLRGPNHAQYLLPHWQIETWSYEELRSVHDDLHEKYGGGISAASASHRGRSSNPLSANRKIAGS